MRFLTIARGHVWIIKKYSQMENHPQTNIVHEWNYVTFTDKFSINNQLLTFLKILCINKHCFWNTFLLSPQNWLSFVVNLSVHLSINVSIHLCVLLSLCFTNTCILKTDGTPPPCHLTIKY